MDNKEDNTTEKEPEKLPGFFKSWNQLYLAVLGELIILVVMFYLFTIVFE